jgi:hypothetical protein
MRWRLLSMGMLMGGCEGDGEGGSGEWIWL